MEQFGCTLYANANKTHINRINRLKLHKEQMLHVWDIYLLSSTAIITTSVAFSAIDFFLALKFIKLSFCVI